MERTRGTRKRAWALLFCVIFMITQLSPLAMAEDYIPEDGSIAVAAPSANERLGDAASYTVGAFSVTGGALNTDYSYADSTLTINSSASLTITTGNRITTDTIRVPNNVIANVTLNNVNINVSNTSTACAFAVLAGGTANITLSGENMLVSGSHHAGLEVPENAAVTIKATSNDSGSLGVSGGGGGAGIGGGYNATGGNITISGGTVNATGGKDSAGIGGGRNGGGGEITISGGTVNATGDGDGASIGGGKGGSGGNITIDGDTVVFATGGSNGAAAIGGGSGDTGTPAPILTKGVVFQDNTGTVHGKPTLPGDLTIPSGSTLTIPVGSTLTIPSGLTLTVPSGSTLTNNGTISGSGNISNSGTVTLASVSITGITAPAIGTAPDTTATVDNAAGYTVSAVTWTGNMSADGNFAYDTAYTAAVTVTAKANYKFLDSVTGEINGQTANVSRASDTEAVLSYTFNAITPPPPPAPTTWAVTVNNGTGNGSYASGATVNITAQDAPTGQVFDKWTTADGVTFANANAASTSFIMPAKAVTVTATYKTSGSSSSSSDSSSSSSSSSDSSTSWSGGGFTTDKTTSAAQADSITTVSMSVSDNGVASMTLSAKHLNDAIAAARKQNGNNSPIHLVVKLSLPASATPDTVTQLLTTLPQAALDSLLANDIGSLTLQSDIFTMQLHQQALQTLSAQADVTISVMPTQNMTLSPEATRLIDGRPAFDIAIDSANGQHISQLGENAAAISIPYILRSGEAPEHVTVFFIDENGTPYAQQSSYDAQTRMITAALSHFSLYAVGYPENTAALTDISGHWAQQDITFVVNRGLLNGTSAALFSPNIPMTRGMFVTALGRLAGVSPTHTFANAFADVDATTYYAPYIAWAAQKGIASGVSNDKFSPNVNITRQEMAVIIANYANIMDHHFPKAYAETAFSDSSSIANWAKSAVTLMQTAGVIQGKENNRFDPHGTATRAEVAAVLHRFITLVID